MYNVNDFKFLLDIVDDLSANLCNSVKGPGEPAGAALHTVAMGELKQELVHFFSATYYYENYYDFDNYSDYQVIILLLLCY